MRRPPSFFLAKRIGAPYAPLEGSIRLDLRNSPIYFLSSSSSTLSSGYSFLFGGAAFSSLSGMLWKNSEGQSERSTGYTGSLKTQAYFYFKTLNYSDASCYRSPCELIASPSPPWAVRWVKFKLYTSLQSFPSSCNYITPKCKY